MWTIYSTGDANFLEQIFISISMVVGSGSFMRGAAIAMLVGVLLMLFQGIMKGEREFNIGGVVLGWILFMIMFIPTTTVIIEDRVTGNDRVVANVPVGVVSAGSIISSIGFGITELFEQGYAYIGGITDGRFAESLNLLNGLRSQKNSPSLFASLNDDLPPGADLRKSWDNYIRECTVRKIDLGQMSADELMKSPMPEALKFDSTIYMTELILNDTPQVMNCTQAYNQLAVTTKGQLSSPLFQEQLTKTLIPSAGSNPYAVSAQTKLNDALQNLGLSTTNSQEFVLASILVPVYEQAVIGRYKDLQEFSSAVAINQAIAQRNTQWTMEQSMFMSVIRPLQTFFEGFVYGITPILAMLIVTGNFGFSMAGKYLQLLFWVQLWLPMLSIINLYICSSAANEMGAYDTMNISSMYSLDSVNHLIQNWVSVGGMLAAAVPMISLFVVTGSTYALTSIAGRLNGADHINEKINAPDVVQPAAMMKQDAMRTNDPIKGTIAPGASDALSSMSVGAALGQATASTSQKATESSQQFSSALSRAVTSNARHTFDSSVGTSLSKAYASSSDHQKAVLDGATSQIQHKYGTDQATASKIAYAVAAGATGNFAIAGKDAGQGKSGASGGLSAQGNVSQTDSQSTNISLGDVSQFLKNGGWSNQDSAGFQGRVASDIAMKNGESFSHEVGDQLGKQLQNSASDLSKSSEAYSKASELRSSLGAKSDTSVATIAGLLEQGATEDARGAAKNLNDYYTQGLATPEQRQYAQKRAQFLENGAGMSPGNAQTAARLEAMMLSKTATPDSISSASNIVSNGLGMAGNQDINPYSNAGIDAPIHGTRGLQSDVPAATGGAAQMPLGDHWGKAAAGHMPAQGNFGPMDQNQSFVANNGVVAQDYKTNAGDIQGKQEAIQAEQRAAEKSANLGNQAAQSEFGSGFWSSFTGGFERLTNNITGTLDFDGARDYALNQGLNETQSEYFAAQYLNHSPLIAGANAMGLREDNSEYLRSQILEQEGEVNGNALIALIDTAATQTKGLSGDSLGRIGTYNSPVN